MDQTSEKPNLPPRASSRSHQESGERKGYESASTERASIQDVLLFLAPPILSAAVLAAIGVNLPRIPSPHPLTDAIILCAGAMAIAVTLWWLLSFLSILWEECVVRRRSTGLNSTYGSRLPRVFTPAFMRRVILAMGSVSIGLSALFAPAQALPGTDLSTPVSADGSANPIQASVPQDSALQESAETSQTTDRQECSTQEITSQSDSASTIIPMGSLQDRSPFFPPLRDTSSSYSDTVRTGDTLWSIAAAQLGEGTDASAIYDYTLDIYEANKELLGYNAELLYQGQVLQIPEQPLLRTTAP